MLAAEPCSRSIPPGRAAGGPRPCLPRAARSRRPYRAARNAPTSPARASAGARTGIGENRRLQFRHAHFHSHLRARSFSAITRTSGGLPSSTATAAFTQQRFGAHDGFHGKIGNVDTGKHGRSQRIAFLAGNAKGACRLHRLARPRAHDFSLQLHSVQQGRVTDDVFAGTAASDRDDHFHPAVLRGLLSNRVVRANGPSLQLNHQRRAGLGAGFLLDQQQHGGGRLHRAAKTKPRGERHAARFAAECRPCRAPPCRSRRFAAADR